LQQDLLNEEGNALVMQ